MTRYLLNVALIRIIFPAILVGCTIWRPVGLSLVYLLLALISPMVSVPTQLSMNGYTSRYFITSICLSFLVTLTQITFHIVLLALPPYGHFLKDCEYLEKILRHIGLVRLDSATPWECFYWLSPEIIVFPSSVIIYCICRRLTRVPLAEDDDNSSLRQHERKSKERSAKAISFLGSIGTYAVLATLCCVASLKPSAEGGFYFLVFIGSATWWACHRELRRGFAIICRFLMAIVAVHIVALLSYQNQWPQEIFPINGTWARYFGLEAIYKMDCKDPRDVEYVEHLEPSTYAYPSRLFLLYFVLALQSKFLFKKPKPASELPSNQHNETTPLMRFGSGRAGLLQDSTGSVVVQDSQQDESHLQSLSEGVTEETPGIFEHIVMAIFSVFQLIVNSSYLATNIIMMTWSIMYHSWTTFALLLWALVLWLVPNKRSAMMKCSPFVVFYSTLLVLIQYVYSMDLNDDELPTIIHGINMSEVGFKKTKELSCWHLIVKSLFMAMFWITMRQHHAEQKKQQRSSTLRDMVAPLQVTVSAATATMNAPEELEIKSKFMKDVGAVVKKLLTKFWIVIVALMLFTSGITGDHMTVFRIVYMSLFLLFIVTFQMSWTIWRKMMYGFWIAVIGYSVVMLILVYTYQFPHFKDYYEDLHIPEAIQGDIGLIKYDTKDLFVRLLTPTFFVIISVLQMHYFHQDFLKVTDIKRVSDDSRKDSYGPSPSTAPIVSSADVFSSENEEDRPALTLRDLKQMSKLERLALFKKIAEHLLYFYNHVWLFLEIHMPKMIFLAFVLLCIKDPCAINFCFILTVAVAINFRRTIQTMIINFMTAAIAVLMVAKMLYQIEYIHHYDWNRNCTEHVPGIDNTTDVIKTYNMAEWIGFKKISPGSTLPNLLEGYIYILAITTIHAMIIVRQWFYRQEKGEPLTTPLVMFPNIKRSDADKGVVPCIKFLLNYGFYKFGLEICMISIVSLIGYRMDFFSVLYCIWLMIFFSLNRKVVASVWPFLRIFVMVVLPLQYASVVAPPTWLCIDYPWQSSTIFRRIQEWMYLPDPDPDFDPDPKKLLCDFFVLLLVVRQSIVFRIEKRSDVTGQEFAAGHNYSVYKDMEKPNFVNPVKDYVSHIHNWLDILKRGSMMSLMWIALSITFLAGTKRTNLFSIGYLIGSFVFLWQGSDFYLRPVHTILKWWNVLIGYNVFVIFCKTIFQGIGCIFITNTKDDPCILIQLLGIACMGKDGDDQSKSTSTCEVNPSDMGLLWDGLCFGFLLLQKRLFRSYYFFHIVDETKAMTILASRGAELLEELHQKRILEQEDAEKAMLQKIKFKMDKIKANQRKIHGPNYREPKTHKIDTLYDPLERPMYRRWSPKTHGQAVRSGDYYMFDDMNDDDDFTDLTLEKDGSDEGQRRNRTRRMTVSELPEQAETLSSAEEDATERGIDEIFDKSEKGSKGGSKSKEGKVSFFTYFKFLWAFLNSIMVSMTRYLNRYSSDYRYIRKVLSKEKKILKAKPDFRMGTRLGISQMWQPLPIVTQRSSAYENSDDAAEDPGEGPSTMDDRSRKSSIFSHVTYPSEEDEEADLSEVDQPPIIQLAASIWLGILAHSTFLCYFMVFLHQINNASILSTPLPLMVFLWGSLTIPRPSKTFWIFLIAYIEVIVIIKCIFQFAFLPVNKIATSSSAITPLRIIGVERKPNYALYELLLLLVLFFHRIMLKSLGQWTRPSSKSRKIIPTGLTIATVRPPQSGDDNKPLKKTELDNEHSGVRLNDKGEIKTPKGTTLHPHLRGAGDGEIGAENETVHVEGDNEKLVIIQTAERSLLEEDFSKAMKQTVVRYLEPMRIFYANILDPSGKEKTNVYAYMFFCDFFNFLLLMIGFSSFGTQQGDGGLASYLAENRVPMQFLLIILAQFALIVIDRALFLKKSMAGKFWFHYFLIVGLHIWMFIVLPSTTERPFNTNTIPQIFYMVKCFYLLLAAYQLRLGYPTRILGNFLCRKFTIFNYCLFKGFMTVPFLFETRAVMDWIWTDTSMTAFDWFKMEDIFANIYQIKCMRGLENDYPQERGVKKTQMSKYFVGGGALLLMIGMIWFPLLLFALGGTVGRSNLPHEVSLKIRIGSYASVYSISAQNSSIIKYSPQNFDDLREIYELTYADKKAITFLDYYVYSDVAAVRLSTDSGRLWEISPPDKARLIDELNSDNEMVIHVEWTVIRDPPTKDMSGVTTKMKDVVLPPKIDGVQNPTRRDLIEAINGDEISQSRTGDIIEYKKRSVLLKNVLPMFVKVTSRDMTVVPQLMWPLIPDQEKPDADNVTYYPYRDVSLVVTNNTIGQQWFSMNENCSDSIYKEKIPLNDCSHIMMFLFNDKVFPDSLSFINGLGILGLYTTAVILVSSYIKRMVSDVTPKIMFEDLPYVDRVMRLCLDIYLVRESGDLCLEEDLFAKLIFLFRSPETLIRWTRLPEPGTVEDLTDVDNLVCTNVG
ncbi:hypothetical protein QAD02_023103 [Eretmocerus hayati]|uniref:Uncharacterized protein n=1 Tax=Eretmocerus hayati TaxID=131215 RepID=A0ACC2PUN5_9HYME|nr:hypothetical protein QAD02_023103 [Eretmocerus hayati]